ncbi:solute carrier organic anion transporter family member 4A1-like [Haemaphysalis longicornis]
MPEAAKPSSNAKGAEVDSEYTVSSFGLSVPQVLKTPPPLTPPETGGSLNHDVNCGLLGFYPAFLQRYRTPRCYLIFICILGMTQGFVVNGLVSVVTPTIEKRFQLLGFDLGMIQSMFNVASCVMVTPVSYHGGVAHKPVILGAGALVMSLGSMVFASPHFLAPPYFTQSNSSNDVCPQQELGKCADADTATSVHSFKYFLMVGHALHGVGSSPFFTLGVAYMDENVPTRSASIYMGGYFLSMYTDVTVDTSRLGMTSSSANWVGAWWLGFFCASIVAFVSAFPVAGFPRALPSAKEKAKDLAALAKKKSAALARKKSATVAPGAVPEEAEKRSLWNHVKRLFTNPTYVFLTFAASAETLIASGLTGFATKIFISMFGISPTKASGILGAVSVPSACGGTMLGGWVITKLNVKSSTIVRYCGILSFIPWFTLFVFMHSCESKHSALVNATHTGADLQIKFERLTRGCNSHCNCTGVMYDPVCGTDNLTYYSPCVAGCASARPFEKTKLFTECSCVDAPTMYMPSKTGTGFYYMAKRDLCAADCGLVAVYAAAMFVALFFTFLLIVPALTALLRSLDEDIKSTGIGLNYVAIRIFGTIPGPMMFGHLIDRSCILWQTSCSGEDGSCAIYDNSVMGMNLFRLVISVKSASIFFFFCASLTSRTQASTGAGHLIPGMK